MKQNIKKFIVALALVAILIAGYFVLFQKPETAAADWWDDSWLYRQTVGITNSETAETDFQVMITLDSATLITANKVQSDCDDIRITDINGKLIPHWIEPTTCNTATTKIWTKVPSISTSGDTVYLYYGNSAVDSKSSLDNIFIREISGVQGAWDMDEASANTCSGGVNDSCDSSGNGNDGAWQADATNTTGKFGNGVAFDGSGDYVDAGLLWSSQIMYNWSTSFWVKFNSKAENNGLVSKGSSWLPNSGFQFFLGNNDYVYFASDTTDGYNSLGIPAWSPDTDQWYQMTLTISMLSGIRSEAKLYIDGNIYKTNHDDNGPMDAESNNFRIGSSHTWYLNGSIDDVRIYDRTLSQSEISDLYGTGGDRQGYVTTNYPNKSLVRKYSATISVGSPASEERGPGPVAYWKFDEGFGQTANDSTINANNGTLGSTSAVQDSDPTWQTEDMCVSGKCLKFDGVDDYVDMGNDSSLNITAITLEAWVYRNVNGVSHEIISKAAYGNKDTNYDFLISSGNVLRLQFGNNSASFDVPSIRTVIMGAWHHVAVTVGGGNVTFYIDGVASGTGTYTGTVDTNTQNLIIGRRGYSITDNPPPTSFDRSFNGSIDSVKIYPYARTAAQIKADYASRGTASGSSAVIASEAKQSLSDGLVGYWKMDEASWNGTADEVVDSSGSGNDGVAVGATGVPTTGAGKFGNGGVFDGVDDYVDAGNDASLDITDAITISAWIKFESVGDGWDGLFVKGGATDGYAIYRNWANIFTFRLFNSSSSQFDLESNTVVTTGNWYYFTATYDGSDMHIYINGNYETTRNMGTPIELSGNNFQIGKTTIGEYFNGSIDSVRIYNRALSPGEVRDLYNFAPGPVGWWKMDEKVSGNGQTINDSSGYGNTGTTVDGANNTGMDCSVLGKYGSGCEFDGVDDYVGVGSDVSLDITKAITVEAWVKLDSFADQYNNIVARGTDYVFAVGSDRKLKTYMSKGGSWYYSQGNELFELNKYYHTVMLYNPSGGNIRLFIDGSEVSYGHMDTTTGSLDSGGTTWIGRYGYSNNYFNGSIDDVRIYNYARTQAQIMEDYSAGAGRKQPIGHWKFDEGYGTTANNSGIGGSSLNGTLTNMASPATSTSGWTDEGKIGKGLVFDGADDYVDCGNITELNTQIGSIEFWYKHTIIPATYQDALYIYQASQTDYLLIRMEDDRIRLVSEDGDIVQFSAYRYMTPDTNWHHIVWVQEGGTIRLHYDGDEKAVTGGSSSWWSNNLTSWTTKIGKAGWTNGFNGSIDDVKIYNYALTEDEVRKEYNQGALLKLGSTGTDSSGNADDSASREYCIPGDTSTCNPPVGRWDFNEGAGSTVNDISGNNNTGTWSGAGEHWDLGKVGFGGSFNGSDDYVDTGKTIISSTSTICAWIKLNTSSQDKAIAGQFYSTFWTSYGEGIKYTNGNIIVMSEVNNDNVALSTALTDTSSWHQVCGIIGTVDGKLYLDGVEKASGDLNSMYGAYWFEIGAARRGVAYSPTNFFNGSIDQVRIYDYARTPAQIAWDYNRGKPIAHWKFDECQGPTANDVSGNGNDGTITIGATGTQDGIGTCTDGDTSNTWYNGRNGKYSSAMSFDGVDDYVGVGTISIADDTPWSVSLWVKPDVITTKGFYGNEYTEGNYSRFFMTSGDIQIRNDTNTKIGDWNEVLSADVWQHIVVVSDGATTATLNLYIDAINKGGYAGADTSQTIKKIGSLGSTSEYLFDGLIDEVKIYNYALTAEQIKTEYNGGAVNFR